MYQNRISMVVALSLIGAALRSSLKSRTDSLFTESGLSIAAETSLTVVSVDKKVSMGHAEALSTSLHSAANY